MILQTSFRYDGWRFFVQPLNSRGTCHPGPSHECNNEVQMILFVHVGWFVQWTALMIEFDLYVGKLERLIAGGWVRPTMMQKHSPSTATICTQFAIPNHVAMLQDADRVEYYKRAILWQRPLTSREKHSQPQQQSEPSSHVARLRVLEVGCGPLALLSLLALQQGAALVDALELNPTVHQFASTFTQQIGVTAAGPRQELQTQHKERQRLRIFRCYSKLFPLSPNCAAPGRSSNCGGGTALLAPQSEAVRRPAARPANLPALTMDRRNPLKSAPFADSVAASANALTSAGDASSAVGGAAAASEASGGGNSGASLANPAAEHGVEAIETVSYAALNPTWLAVSRPADLLSGAVQQSNLLATAPSEDQAGASAACQLPAATDGAAAFVRAGPPKTQDCFASDDPIEPEAVEPAVSHPAVESGEFGAPAANRNSGRIPAAIAAAASIGQHQKLQQRHQLQYSQPQHEGCCYDLVIHEILGDFASQEGAADVIRDIQSRTQSIPKSIPFAARTFIGISELPSPCCVKYPASEHAERSVLSPRRRLLQSVGLRFSQTLLCAQLQAMEELQFEAKLDSQMLQRRQLNFTAERDGLLAGLLAAVEIEIRPGLFFGPVYEGQCDSWYTNMVLLGRDIRISKGDTVCVSTEANLTNFQRELQMARRHQGLRGKGWVSVSRPSYTFSGRVLHLRGGEEPAASDRHEKKCDGTIDMFGYSRHSAVAERRVADFALLVPAEV
ncbi:hypothetical protein Efla_003060 [Eimeria flavescens]